MKKILALLVALSALLGGCVTTPAPLPTKQQEAAQASLQHRTIMAPWSGSDEPTPPPKQIEKEKDPTASISLEVWNYKPSTSGIHMPWWGQVAKGGIISPEGFYAGCWLWDASNKSKELDLTLGWNGERFGLVWDAGAQVFDLWQLQSRFFDTYLKVGKKFRFGPNEFTPYIKPEWALQLRNTPGVPEGGTYLGVGLEHYLHLDVLRGVDIWQDLRLLTDDGAYGLKRTTLVRYSGKLSWGTPVPWLKINLPIIELIGPTEDLPPSDDRRPVVAVAAGITGTFDLK
jgi:hypothetical protein